jgi:two-component system phosphate regulon sensor histidine kinase PhoR
MKSIRWRIAIPYIFLAVVTIAGMAWFLTNRLEAEFQNLQKNRLISESKLVAEMMQPLLTAGDFESINERAKSLHQTLGVRVTVILPDGKVVGESDADPTFMENHINRPEVRGALDGNPSSEIRFSNTLLTHFLYIAVPVYEGNQIIGVTRLSMSLASIQSTLETMNRILLAIAIVAILLVIILAFWISEYTVRPIRQLTRAAEQVGSRDFSTNPILDRKDEIGALSRSFEAMSDNLRKQFQELETEQDKLFAILNAMSDGVAIVDRDGLVQLLNPTASRLFNITEHQAIGHTLTETLRHHQIVDLWKASRSSGEQQSLTIDLSSEKLYVHVVVTPLREAMQGAALVLFQDLTRLRKLETVRQDFISNVSHELRTPLAAVKSLAETLQEGALEDPPAARRFLSLMETEIDTMSQLVQELLELSRIESGKAPFQKKMSSVESLITQSVERMSHQAERAGLRLIKEIEPGLPDINMDVERMQQVMGNLIHNAIKFTSPGGLITVSAKKMEKAVQVSIRDTGVGIADEDIPRIFERFYKADRARASGGTGLGLSIARHIVEGHGGNIWLESQIGEGSTFYFSIPS